MTNKTNALSISMMTGNALFTVALILGAFDGTYAPIAPYVIWAMALSFVVFAVLFFSTMRSFSRLLKISGSVFALASSLLAIVLGVLSSTVLPDGEEGSTSLAIAGLAILVLGGLLFLSFYQTYFMLARLNRQFLLGVAYLVVLSLILIFSGTQGNTFALNLGITSLMVTAAAWFLDRKNPII